MTVIKPHLSAAELEQCYKSAIEPIAKSHFHALWLLSQGYDIDETAAILSFSTRWVRILIKRYNAGGPELLGDQRVFNSTTTVGTALRTLWCRTASGSCSSRPTAPNCSRPSICGRSSTSR